MLSSSGGLLEANDGGSSDALGFLAGVSLCVLAYKGFTTITNQGDDIADPERNIARSIAISIVICAVVYLLITVAVASTIGADGAVRARDYALAEAADPLSGSWGVALTAVIAVVATLSRLLASLFSVSRLYGMLQEMGQAPRLPGGVAHQPLLITAGLAIVVTVTRDLSQIASMGVVLYLTMDIAVQWGLIRRLRDDVPARRWIPGLTIVLDAAVLAAFVIMKLRDDVLTIGVALGVAGIIVAAQWFVVRHRPTEDGSRGTA